MAEPNGYGPGRFAFSTLRVELSLFEDGIAAHLMTYDEARRIAVNVAKLPELLTKPD